MRARFWLILGVALGIALGVGKLPYFRGAAGSLTSTALRLVATGGLTLVHDVAKLGAPRRLVQGLSAGLGVLLPGMTALLLVMAGRATLGVRRLTTALLAGFAIGAFFYLPAGTAGGVALLSLAAAALVAVATGPLLVAPLSALASLIAIAFLPRLLSANRTLPTAPVSTLHQAIVGRPGSPLWAQVLTLVLAAVPFAAAARLLVR